MISIWPIFQYTQEINKLIKFTVHLKKGSHTVSETNALREYRFLLEKGRLLSPVETNKKMNEIRSLYLIRYPILKKFFKIKNFNFYSVYSLTLTTGTTSFVHKWTWDKIVTFDPKRERSLLTNKIRKEIKERDNYICQNCGEDLKHDLPGRIHIDHKLPIAKGGKTEINNLQVLCCSCNLTKNRKLNS